MFGATKLKTQGSLNFDMDASEYRVEIHKVSPES